MSIISTLPYTLTNGTTADAIQVMANLNQIVTGVNSNAASTSIAQAWTAQQDFSGTTVLVAPATASNQAVQAGQTMGKNKIINGDFKVNQKVLTSPQTLITGVPSTGVGYGHDMWRGGASGCTYSFTNANLGLSSVATITAGSLITAVESVNIDATTYVLSWTGTAVARIGVNGAAPSGNFAASPIYITTAVIGTQTSVEFAMSGSVGGSSIVNTGTGTLSLVQMEEGIYKTTFERKLYDQVLRECQRYLTYFLSTGINDVFPGSGVWRSTTRLDVNYPFPVQMRAAPTFTVIGTIGNLVAYSGGASNALTALSGNSQTYLTGSLNATVASGGTTGYGGYITAANSIGSGYQWSAQI